MATWAMRKRYEWIDARLAANAPFNRDDIVQAFTVTKQTASATIREYCALQPDALRYDGARKAFVRADTPEGAKGLTRRERAALDVLTWLDERGRNSTSYGSHADAYEIAARRLRLALEDTPAVQQAWSGGTEGCKPDCEANPKIATSAA